MFGNLPLVRLTVAAALTVASCAFSVAAGADERIIVETAFVEDAMTDGSALVWDVRSQKDYLKGHIPGAVNVGSATKVLRESRTQDYVPVDEIARILGAAGISDSREIIVYGSKASPAAYFGYITLRYLGVTDVTVYHGGIDDWKDADKPVETNPVKLPPATFMATPDPSQLATTAEVIRKLGDDSVQIIDARTTQEFSGEDIRALRGGHIPGAVNIPFQANWVDPDTPRKLARKKVDNKDGMNLKPRDELEAMYAQLDKDKETIVYCQSGGRASETAVILQDLGFKNVRIYDSSWIVYGNTFQAPVENVTYFNVGRVNSMIRSLQIQIDTLEGEIATLKAAQKQQ